MATYLNLNNSSTPKKKFIAVYILKKKIFRQ